MFQHNVPFQQQSTHSQMLLPSPPAPTHPNWLDHSDQHRNSKNNLQFSQFVGLVVFHPACHVHSFCESLNSSSFTLFISENRCYRSTGGRGPTCPSGAALHRQSNTLQITSRSPRTKDQRTHSTHMNIWRNKYWKLSSSMLAVGLMILKLVLEPRVLLTNRPTALHIQDNRAVIRPTCCTGSPTVYLIGGKRKQGTDL